MKMTMLGSGVRAPFVLRGLSASGADLGLDEVVLHDTDGDRLELMAALGGHLCAEWGAGFTVRAEPDPRAAIAGARFVFSAIRPGQEAARVVDEEVPLKHGVLGQETTGPGGFAMALRTIPAMLGYARLIEEVAPDALLVNFTNPVGIVMQALHDHSSVRAVGICDGPVSMQRSVAEFLGLPREQVHADYFGLNHCGWIHRVLVDGHDRLPELLDRFEELQAADERVARCSTRRSSGPSACCRWSTSTSTTTGTRRWRTSAAREALAPAAPGAERRAVAAAADVRRRRRPCRRARGVGAGDERARRDLLRARAGRGRPTTMPSEPDDVFEGEGYQGVAMAVMLAAVHRRPDADDPERREPGRDRGSARRRRGRGHLRGGRARRAPDGPGRDPEEALALVAPGQAVRAPDRDGSGRRGPTTRRSARCWRIRSWPRIPRRRPSSTTTWTDSPGSCRPSSSATRCRSPPRPASARVTGSSGASGSGRFPLDAPPARRGLGARGDAPRRLHPIDGAES